MNQAKNTADQTPSDDIKEPPAPLQSGGPVDSLRQRILANARPKSKKLEFFGQTVELRQPPLKAILQAQEIENRAEAVARMIVQYVFDPTTGKPVFNDADVELLQDLPFGHDMAVMQQAITELTDIDMEAGAKN